MTEIEARGKIKYRIANEMRKYGENKEEYEDLEIALQVMKELREYRELGSVEELKDLKRFKPGMKWSKAGGTQAVYNDSDDFIYTDPASGNQVHITKNVAIIPSTYVMTYSRDYMLLLNEIQLYSEFRKERE